MENESYEKYLPLGTIVKLKGGKKKLMITGFCLYDNDHGHVLYDYCGCMYPEGMISSKELNLFNHEDIEDVIHLGVSDEEDKKFKVNLTSMLQIIETVHPGGEVENIINIDDNVYENE